ncbi:MAG: helix-turn-helix transcriptional regulator [Erythrobacter sp.]|jgi:DNA-binding CsgD family transcriptional regulator
MSVTPLPPSTVAALCDKELEILRLLASGHTAKSIAARLGRSEAAINERLREARRKTGVGSSRELARLLDAQKIWDENIDLTKASCATDALSQPQSVGRSWQKGTMLMLLTIPVAAVGLLLSAAGSLDLAKPMSTVDTAAGAPSPLVGNWSLDVDRIPAQERPRRVTITFQVSPDQHWTTRVEIVGPDGSTSHAESTAALDGVPVSISGTMRFIDTVALRQPAPDTLVMTLGKNGSPVSTRVYTVAKDARSMTETIIWASEGVPKLETTYFARAG